MIERAHAALLPSDLLRETRREIYRFLAGPRLIDYSLLDNPLVRNVLHRVAADAYELSVTDLERVRSIGEDIVPLEFGDSRLHVLCGMFLDDQLADVRASVG